MPKDINSADWLPHALPMRMLEDIVAYTDTALSGKCTINAGNPFLQDNVFPVVTGLELLAQAAGVLFGLRKSGICTHGANVKEKTAASKLAATGGAVVQIKAFEVFLSIVPMGAELDVSVDYIGGTDTVVMMRGALDYRQQTVLTATLMIAMFQEDN